MSKEWDKETAEKLADEHWEWFLKRVGEIAKDFFIHGYKHGMQDEKEKQKGDETP